MYISIYMPNPNENKDVNFNYQNSLNITIERLLVRMYYLIFTKGAYFDLYIFHMKFGFIVIVLNILIGEFGLLGYSNVIRLILFEPIRPATN